MAEEQIPLLEEGVAAGMRVQSAGVATSNIAVPKIIGGTNSLY